MNRTGSGCLPALSAAGPGPCSALRWLQKCFSSRTCWFLWGSEAACDILDVVWVTEHCCCCLLPQPLQSDILGFYRIYYSFPREGSLVFKGTCGCTDLVSGSLLFFTVHLLKAQVHSDAIYVIFTFHGNVITNRLILLSEDL